jgi:nucleotide-binding universal stress UspA family protein
MIERILTPLDGSMIAEAILPQVQRLARKTGAEIVLARAIPVPGIEAGDAVFRASIKAGTEYLAGIQARLESFGFRVRSILRTGGAAETVLSLAAETRASLLAIATHGRTGAPRLVLGSVSETILRSTPIPVLALRPFWTYELQPPGGVETQPIRTILVPVGSGGLSLCVLPHAVEMAKLFGARVMVVHAASASDEPHEEEVAEIAERFRLEGIETTTLVEPGDPAETILSACRSRAVDLAVMSTHGRNGLSRVVLGSVTEEVLRGARVPLLVVRGDPSAKAAWGLKSGSASLRR